MDSEFAAARISDLDIFGRSLLSFLFRDTPSGVTASARILSVITARANNQNAYEYLSVLLTELPQATCVEDVERLLP